MRPVLLRLLILGWLATPAFADIAPKPTPAQQPQPTEGQGPQPATARVPTEPGTRGQLLYENHCTGCHESVVFVREHRTVEDMQQLRSTVRRWAEEAGTSWGREEIEDVVQHLDRSYYHFPKS
jgi:mono/diheme cytochrome c family protein